MMSSQGYFHGQRDPAPGYSSQGISSTYILGPKREYSPAVPNGQQLPFSSIEFQTPYLGHGGPEIQADPSSSIYPGLPPFGHGSGRGVASDYGPTLAPAQSFLNGYNYMSQAQPSYPPLASDDFVMGSSQVYSTHNPNLHSVPPSTTAGSTYDDALEDTRIHVGAQLQSTGEEQPSHPSRSEELSYYRCSFRQYHCPLPKCNCFAFSTSDELA